MQDKEIQLIFDPGKGSVDLRSIVRCAHFKMGVAKKI